MTISKENMNIIFGLIIVGLLYLLFKLNKPIIDKFVGINKVDDRLKLYYAEWCGHCHKLMPTWNELHNTELKDIVEIHKYECSENKFLCTNEGVQGYPTIILETNGKKVRYEGDRTKEDIIQFVKSNINK